MGTTIDKLNKLKTTKEAIRTAINNKGGILTTSDKFSDYATAIDNIQSGGGGSSLKILLDKTKSAKFLFPGKAYYGQQISTQFYYMKSSDLENIITYNDTSSCTTMEFMFYFCENLETIPLLNTSACTNMSSMFYNCTSLTTIPQLDTSKVTNMSEMFYHCSKLTTIPQFDTSKVTNMNTTFSNCSNLISVPQLNTSKVTSMYYTFYNCSNLTHVPQLDTSKVTNMESTFNGCSNLISVPQLNTSSCTNVVTMFAICYKLATIDITHMKCSNMNSFAYRCYSLTKLIIRNMDTIPTLNSNAFADCYHFYGTQNSWYNPEGLKDGRIYVPDDKVEELKTATNWSVFADIIVPLGTLVEE